MSAAGFTPIQLYRTTTASAVPSAGNLADGELAINLTDEALYFKNAAGVVTLLADSSGALGSVTSVNASGGTTGLTFSGGPITSSGTLTLGGTLAVANGGTGVTTSTGTGSVVLSNSPTLVTPTLGVASATSIATGKGTVGSVAYGFTTNTNTGMWSPSSDAIAFSTAGSERLRINSSGNVGIGTSAPAQRLHVATTAAPSGTTQSFLRATADVGFGADFGGGIIQGVGPIATISTVSSGTATERMRIDSSGNVGIGTSSPGKKLDVVGQFRISGAAASGYALAEYGTSATATNNWHVGSEGDGTFRWYNGTLGAGTERMRITSAGLVGIGTTSPSAAARLDVSSTTSGFLPPRMTTAQRDAISSPPNGLMLYNTSTDKLQVRAAGAWVDLH